MKASIKFGRIFGVELGLHYTWFLIAALIAISLAERFMFEHPGWSLPLVLITALITAVLFFITLLIHELSHALVARLYDIPVKSITLFALGGVANIEKDALSPKAEFWMGIVGPITSAIIGALFLWTSAFLGQMSANLQPAVESLSWLGYINLIIAAFNMIPGFPLDGGRILKAIVWWMTGDSETSTRIALNTGRIVALLFMLGGVLIFFATGVFTGLWLSLIGWFLFTGVEGTSLQNSLKQSLKDVQTSDAMSTIWKSVPSDMLLSDFVEEISKSWRRCFFVYALEQPDRMIGLVTPKDVGNVSKDEWRSKTIASVMQPLRDTISVSPDTPLMDALEAMAERDINQLPVVDRDERVVGVISRANVIQIFKNRTDLGLRSA